MAEKNEEKLETKKEIIKDIEKSGVPKEVAKKEEALDEKATEEAKEKKEEQVAEPKEKAVKAKKTEAVVRAENIPISTKDSISICRFIKGKTISKAIKDLELVILEKKAIPAIGEHPHKKGKRMSGGIYAKKASKNFIILLKSLAANASDISDPIIVEAVPNIGKRPYGRFGRYRRKRTHICIKAKERKNEKK
ncbi:MAG: uL22 family ribosomal protein [Nanoarchaeota archaeon]